MQDVVKVLSVEPPSTEEKLRFANRYHAAAGNLPRNETRPFTAAWLSHSLRNYVDPWLQTGRSPDGREFPWQRQVCGASFGAVLLYLQQYPAQVDFLPEAGLVVCLGGGYGHPTGPGKLYDAAEAEARRLFTGLVVRDQRQCLCKCAKADCGRYFLLPKPRRVYKHGTFCCRLHQMGASAQALTRNRRAKTTEKLIELAAQQLFNWNVRTPNWADTGRQKARLAKTLSQQIRRNPNLQTNRCEIQVNWVTWHRRQIEQKRVQIQKKT